MRGLGRFPEFEPHITLLTKVGEESIDIDKLGRAINSIGRPRVMFRSVEAGVHYFRSVYIRVEMMMGLQERLRGEEGFEVSKFPLHLSLCYVEDSDGEMREVLVEKMKREGMVVRCGEMVKVKYGPGDDWIEGFEGGEIWLMECIGLVKDWKLIERYPI